MKILLAVALCLAVASPALAEFKLNGYYRLQGVAQTHIADGKSNDPKNQSIIDQRLRMKLTNTLNEYVSFVYYAEVDTPWGEPGRANAGGSLGGGGKLGADGVNLETKNVYLDFKIPDTSLALRTGVQWWADSYDAVVAAQDMAAAKLTGKLGALNLQLLYSKWDEGDSVFGFGTGDNGASRASWNDTDFYLVEVGHSYNDSAKVGASVFFLDNNDADDEIFVYGLNGDFRSGDLGIKGWVLYKDGELANDTVDTSALAASVRAGLVIPTGDVALRVTYVSEDDDAADDDSWDISEGTTEFGGEGLMIFFEDALVNSTGTSRFAFADSVDQGFGLLAVNGRARFDKGLPMDLYANLAAGAFWSMTDDADDDNVDVREGESLGYEVAAQVGKKFAEKVDVSLRGAYAFFGDFYDNQAVDGGDPDDVYKVAFMVNVPF